jgi:hypothetical protein
LKGKNFCPTNSQATLWRNPIFPFLYLPVTSSFRMTDIWRGIIVAGYMREKGLNTVFGKLGFMQERNLHNLVSDFLDEVPGHKSNRLLKKMSDDTWSTESKREISLEDKLILVYKKLVENGLLSQLDMDCIEEFIFYAHEFS